jgi:hypothetical protein
MSMTKSEVLRGFKQKVSNDRSGVRRAKAEFSGVFHPAIAPAGSDRVAHGEVAEVFYMTGDRLLIMGYAF